MNAREVMLQAALGYTRHGWPCFVLSPTKTPVKLCGSDACEQHRGDPAASEACECLTCHGFYSATTDPGRLAEMFRRHPRGLLAMRTGEPSGTVVVDVDLPDGPPTMALLDQARLLPGTVMQATGSGGLHLLYAHPGVRITSGAGRLGPGVDVKADDAYIVLAPSIHPKTGARYAWSGDGRYDYPLTPLHSALVERLGPQPERPRTTVAQLAMRSDVRPRGRLRGLIEAVLTAPPKQGNQVLLWASCRAAEMVTAGDVDEHTATEALCLAAVERGRPEGEARRTIVSGMRRGAA